MGNKKNSKKNPAKKVEVAKIHVGDQMSRLTSLFQVQKDKLFVLKTSIY